VDGLRRLFALFVFPGALSLIALSMLLSWLDRKLVAVWQGRVGPPWYQPLADFIKLLAKEDISPWGTDRLAAAMLPILSLACVMAASQFVPLGNSVLASFEGDLIVALFLLSLPTVAYFLAGWVTPGVYGVLGGNRALLQYFAYEVPLLLGLAAPAVYSQSWRIAALMDAQRGYHWRLFVLPLGFAIAVLGLIGKLARPPLDIPQAKAEVGAGPLTEYSGRKLALWRLTLWLQTLVGINLLVAVYLGGADRMWGAWGFAIYLCKVAAAMLGLTLVQALYARMRIDQMVDIGWRLLVPLGLLQMLAAVWMGG
jgi:NADH-quinone oxidoreductase subunit H